MSNKWVAAAGGAIPEGAKEQGKDIDGTQLFVARAAVDGGTHPGKVRSAFKGANIPYGGKEVNAFQYEVFVGVGRWQKMESENGDIPSNAMIAGHEKDGTPLYVARAVYGGGLHPGKVRPGFKGANIPYGGKEITISQYEVLVD